MTLQVYRIDNSLFGKIANIIKPPSLPLVHSAIPFFGDPIKNFKDTFRSNFYVLSKRNEIDRFKEAFNSSWVSDKYYIRHPKKIKTDILIPAEKFPQYIIREQISDIVSYIRSNVRSVRKIVVTVSNANNAKIAIKNILSNIYLSGDARLDSTDEYTIIINCNSPLKASETETKYTWLEDFSTLISVVDSFSDSYFVIHERHDTSFGLDVELAKSIGVNTILSKQHKYTIAVEAA